MKPELDFKLTKNHRITFLTGAGISAESGIPTFRGKKGLWEEVDIEEYATPQGFERNPKKVWEWYDLRRTQALQCKPNPAHLTLASLEKAGYDVTVITQNIDNLHREAGQNNIIELHGNIWYVRCTRYCGVWQDKTAPFADLPPLCACGSILRPHVVWFGEMLDEIIISQAFYRCMNTDLCVVIGTSGTVYPAAGMAEMAKAEGAYVVEVNLESTPISIIADESHFGNAGDILPGLFGECIG
jgi:NAD-dependent deacetylase